MDIAAHAPDFLSSLDQTIAETLVVAFRVMMFEELVHRSAHRFLSEEDHAVETFPL